MINDEYINLIFWENNKFKYTLLKKLDNNIKKYLLNRYNDSESLKETIYRIKYNIVNRPVCPICNNKVKFIGNNNIIFRTTCCLKCSNINNYSKISKTKLTRYGDSYYSNRDKAKNTIKEKYGNNYKDIVGTKISESLNNRTIEEKNNHYNKIKNTLKEKYNIENPGQLINHKDKLYISKIINGNNIIDNIKSYKNIKDTCLIKYGEDNISKVSKIKEKRKQTILSRYGVENIWNLDKYKEKAHNEESKLKIIETCRKRYNCDYALQNEDIKIKVINNKSYNKYSKPELETYKLLLSKFDKEDIKCQYGNKLYPFKCDFYICSLDLYIECQYSIFHNKRKYIGSKEDLLEIEDLKNKANKRKQILGIKKSQYDMIIYTWSDLDVRKREYAIKNNLNFIEFWNIEDVKKWLKNIENTL